MTNNLNGWNEWGKHVLRELERLDSNIDKINVRLIGIEKNIAGLKIKARMWGALGGAVPVALAILVYIVKKMI